MNYEYDDTIKYIYEHADGVTYIRKFGAPVHTRRIFSVDVSKKISDEKKVWNEIVEQSFTNLTLKKELDRIKLMFYLKNDNTKT